MAYSPSSSPPRHEPPSFGLNHELWNDLFLEQNLKNIMKSGISVPYVGKNGKNKPINIGPESIPPVSGIRESIRNKMDHLGIWKSGIPEAEETIYLQKMNTVLQEAKRYLTEYLGLSGLPGNIQKLSFSQRKDVEDFLGYISREKGNNPATGLVYCALAKIAHLMLLTEEQEFQDSPKEAQYLFQKFITYASGHRQYTLRKISNGDDFARYALSYFPNPDDRSVCKVVKISMSFRGKNPERCLLKMLRRPGEELTDVLGIKIEVENESEGESVMPLILGFFKNMSLDESTVVIKNKNFFPHFDALAKDWSGKYEGCIFSHERNASSHERFSSLAGISDIYVPRGGVEGAMVRKRGVEIQMVVRGNKNEKGMAAHEVYEAEQKIMAMNQLFGTISREHIVLFAKEAAKKKGVSWESIVDHLLKAMVRVNHHNSVRYIHIAILERNLQSGLLLGEIVDDTTKQFAGIWQRPRNRASAYHL